MGVPEQQGSRVVAVRAEVFTFKGCAHSFSFLSSTINQDDGDDDDDLVAKSY